jgi:hypothetical protein
MERGLVNKGEGKGWGEKGVLKKRRKEERGVKQKKRG